MGELQNNYIEWKKPHKKVNALYDCIKLSKVQANLYWQKANQWLPGYRSGLPRRLSSLFWGLSTCQNLGHFGGYHCCHQSGPSRLLDPESSPNCPTQTAMFMPQPWAWVHACVGYCVRVHCRWAHLLCSQACYIIPSDFTYKTQVEDKIISRWW